MQSSEYSNYNLKNLNEAEKRISKRWKRNKIKLKFKKNDKILIFGTLNYSKAILNLGSKKIYAVDNCNKPNFLKTTRFKKIKYKKINFNEKLNFKKNNFDFIFCNGILTHLNNWENILKNFFEVLKPSGKLWINNFNDSKLKKMPISLNKKINSKDRKMVKEVLRLSGWEVGKIKFIVDTFFWENRILFNKEKLEKKLRKIGFTKLIFCKRGFKDDTNELVYKNKKLKKLYGSGDLRYLVQK